MISPKQSYEVHLLVKVHEEDNFILNGRKEVVFVDKLVDVFVSESQVDLQSSVIALVICVSKDRHKRHSEVDAVFTVLLL